MRLPAAHVERLAPLYGGRHVCVTGGCGFIGSHLVDALLSLGAHIAVLDDLSNADSEHVAGLIDLEPERVRFVRASVLDDNGVRDAMDGAEVVFHLAAIGSVPQSIADPERTYAVNATGTLRVLEAARRAGVRRVVLSSSSSVYGPEAAMPSTEDARLDPVSPYAASKAAGEHLLLTWARSFGLSSVSLRYFNVFGPRQRPDSPYAAVIPLFVRALLAGEPPVVFGDGEQTRDFTPVANAVFANLLAGASERRFAGEAVNVGAGERRSVLDLARAIAGALGVDHPDLRHEAERPGDVRHSMADITRARELLGYEPIGSFGQGLEETVRWFQEHISGAGAR